MKKVFQTNDSAALAISRIMLGLVLFPHGAQKLLGWFGGYGFNATMGFLTGGMNLPWIIAFLVIIIEFFGALALILGIGTRIISVAVIFLFAGIIFTSHGQNGFFMNWGGKQAGEGFEYHLLVIAIAVTLLIGGAGKWSVDYAVQKTK
jgi:putative oxidoreductase